MGGFLGAFAPVRSVPSIVERACRPKPIATSREDSHIRALLYAALAGRSYEPRAPLVGGGATTLEYRDPWRQLYRGTVTTLYGWSVEWKHAGRTYRLAVEKQGPAWDAWYWRVQTTRAGSRPLVEGRCLASLRALVVETSPVPGGPRAALRHEYQRRDFDWVPPVGEPEPVRWPATS